VKRYRELDELDKNGVRFIAWLVCGAALLALALWRTSLSDIGTQAGRFGGVVGAILGPLLIASLLWLLVRGILAALSSIDRSELDDFLHGVEAEARGARTEFVQREIGDADTRVVDPPDGSRAIFGVTTCRALIVLGVQKRSAELLAPSVFKN
jgi:hypothetical protein